MTPRTRARLLAVLAAFSLGAACVCDPLGVDSRLFHCTTTADCGAGTICASDNVCRAEDLVPDAGPSFVQENCGSLPPLSCAAFSLGDGGAYGVSALASIDGGFIAALEFLIPHRVDFFRLDGHGFSGPLASWPLGPGTVTSLSVAGSGEAWAIAWVKPAVGTSTAPSVACVGAVGLSAIPPAPAAVATPSASLVSVAVNAAGDIALAASDPNALYFGAGATMRSGLGAGGCPSALVATQGGMITVGPAAVATGDGGFWLMGTGLGFSVYQPVSGAFTEAGHFAVAYDSYEQTTTVSSDGSRLQTLFRGLLDDGGTTLAVMPVRVDRSPPSFAADVLLFPGTQPTVFGSSSCGPGCTVDAVVPSSAGPRNILVAFTDDGSKVTGLGAESYTASCGKSANAKGLSVAWSLGLLGFLYSDATHANFYLCQKPVF